MSKRKPKKILKQKSTEDSRIIELGPITKDLAERLSDWWLSMNIPVRTNCIQRLVDVLAPLREEGIIGAVCLAPFEPEGYEGLGNRDKTKSEGKKPYVVTWWFMSVPIMKGCVPDVVDVLEPLRDSGIIGDVQLVPFHVEDGEERSDPESNDGSTRLH